MAQYNIGVKNHIIAFLCSECEVLESESECDGKNCVVKIVFKSPVTITDSGILFFSI